MKNSALVFWVVKQYSLIDRTWCLNLQPSKFRQRVLRISGVFVAFTQRYNPEDEHRKEIRCVNYFNMLSDMKYLNFKVNS
jgi:hypothetical protein